MWLLICVGVFSKAADAVVVAGGMVDGGADGVVAGGVVVLAGFKLCVSEVCDGGGNSNAMKQLEQRPTHAHTWLLGYVVLE